MLTSCLESTLRTLGDLSPRRRHNGDAVMSGPSCCDANGKNGEQEEEECGGLGVDTGVDDLDSRCHLATARRVEGATADFFEEAFDCCTPIGCGGVKRGGRGSCAQRIKSANREPVVREEWGQKRVFFTSVWNFKWKSRCELQLTTFKLTNYCFSFCC